jgi:endonuclease III
MAACGHRQLVTMLGEGRYVRYDESTATRLTALCRKLIDHYDGQVSELVQRSLDSKDLARRLQEFDGIGPKTYEIFTREVLAIQ